MKIMTKLLIIILTLVSLSGFSQTNPKITLTGTTSQATIYKGAVGSNTAMLLPLGTHDEIYPDLPLKGRIQFNDETNKLEIHNGTEWVEVDSNGDITPLTAQQVYETGSTVAIDTTIEYKVTTPDSTNFSTLTMGVNEYEGIFSTRINMFSTQYIGAWSVGNMSFSANQGLSIDTPGTLSISGQHLDWNTVRGRFSAQILDDFDVQSNEIGIRTQGSNYLRMNETDGITFNAVNGDMQFQTAGFGDIKFDHDDGLRISGHKKLSLFGGSEGVDLISGDLTVSATRMKFNGGLGVVTVPFEGEEGEWMFFKTNVTPDPALNGYSIVGVNDEDVFEQYGIIVTLIVDGTIDSYYFERYDSEIIGSVFRRTEISGSTIEPLEYQKQSFVSADIEMILPKNNTETRSYGNFDDVVFIDNNNKLKRGNITMPTPSFVDVLNQNSAIDSGWHYIPMYEDTTLFFYGDDDNSAGLYLANKPNPAVTDVIAQLGVVDSYGYQKTGLSIYKDKMTVKEPIVYTDDQAYYYMKDNGDMLASADFVRQGFIEYIAWPGLTGGIGQQHYFIDITASGSRVDLPDASYYKGKKYIFKCSFTGGSATVKPLSGQTIDGSNSLPLTITNQTFEIVSDGSNWKILSAYKPG